MLLRKMLRDMRIHKIQFISIFLMSFLALFIYSGLGSESKGYEKELNSYYSETHFADVWLYSTNFTQEDEEKVQALEEVDLVQRRLSAQVTAVMETNASLTLYFEKENKVNQVYLKEGSEFNPADTEGIWLDTEFAAARGLSCGDTIELTYLGLNMTKTIRGLVLSPEYIYMQSSQMIPDHFANGFAYVPYAGLPAGFPKIMTEMVLTVDHDKMSSISELEEKLYDLLPPDAATQSGGLTIFLDRDNNVSHTVFVNEITERKSMTAVFPIAFIAIALLTIMTTMTRMVQNQRTQIGILKALGFQKKRIMRHYLIYSFALTGVGGLLGAVIGPFVLPQLFYPTMKTVYVLPVYKPAFMVSSLLVIACCVLTATAITYFSCCKILRELPAEELRPKAPKTAKLSWFEKTGFWKKRGFTTQWNVRDSLRSKSRSLMAIAGVTGCMGLLIAGFGCLDAFDSMISIKYNDICKYKNCYMMEETATQEEIDAVRTAVNGQQRMEKTIEIKSDTGKETATLEVNDEVTMYQYLGESFEAVSLPDEGISISKKIAETLDVSIGDTITWHLYGDHSWNESKVTAIYRDPTEQGAAMSRAEFEHYGFTFCANVIFSNNDQIDNLAGVATIDTAKGSKASIEQLLTAMYLLIGAVCIFAALLAIVVLYNLGVLSFTEKERELATLKVIGFQTGRIRKLLLQQNVMLSVLGLFPGYLFGIFILRTVMASMGKEFDLLIKVTLPSFVICVVFTMSISIAVTYFFSGKMKKLDMVSSLKGVE